MAVTWTEDVEREALDGVREIALSLPEVSERLSHGSPSFFVREKKTLLSFVSDHHGDGNLGIWCPAPPGAQEMLIGSEPERFYRPDYVGHRGWVGIRLDAVRDWDELREFITDAYRLVAPKTLVKLLDAE